MSSGWLGLNVQALLLCRLKASVRKAESLEKENQDLKGNLSVISSELTSKAKENLTLTEKLERVGSSNKEVRHIA